MAPSRSFFFYREASNQFMDSRHWNLCIGIVFAALSAITLFAWIPADIETGVIVQERRAIVVGDAMAPTAAAAAILILSLALIVSSLLAVRSAATPADDGDNPAVSPTNILNMAIVLGILFASMALMVWTGPLIVSLLQGVGLEVPAYRLLTDTVPYKYLGFAAGGFVLVFGLISWITGQPSLRAAITAVCAVLVLIIVYDVPFDSLLLPPNGSQ